MFHLTYYKALLDKCIYRFFQEYNNMFLKQDDNYVLCQGMTSNKLQSIFKKMIVEEICQIIKPFDRFHPQYFFIIGSCMPKDNLLLEFKDSSFPKKLDNLIQNSDLKYILKEKDIKIDIQKLNYAVIEVFNKMFKSKLPFGKQYPNVIFIQNNQLDCYSMFKIIKHLYGKNNCTALFDQNVISPIIAVNDMISRYVQNKTAMNKSKQLKKCAIEVKQYIDEKIKECYCG